jgi:catechol 2,3-dioxygenase-like lactoylglutathione lyase family enzyme
MPNEVRFIYTGIRDLARSLRFYQALGFRLFRRGKMEHGGEWVHLKFPGSHHRFELNYYPPGSTFYHKYVAGSELDHVGFYFTDLPRWIERAERAGGRVKAEVPDGPNRLVYIADPDGIWLEFIGPGRAARPVKRKRPTRKST